MKTPKITGGGYWYKTVSKSETKNKYYGWDYCSFENADWNHEKIINHHFPSAPYIKKINKDNDKIEISWQESYDLDNDLRGYKVYLSSSGRGWDYSGFYGDNEVISYWDNPKSIYGSKAYNFIENLPSGDIEVIDIQDCKCTFSMRNSDCYIVIMPYDDFGISIGEKVWNSSNEIHIKVE